MIDRRILRQTLATTLCVSIGKYNPHADIFLINVNFSFFFLPRTCVLYIFIDIFISFQVKQLLFSVQVSNNIRFCWTRRISTVYFETNSTMIESQYSFLNKCNFQIMVLYNQILSICHIQLILYIQTSGLVYKHSDKMLFESNIFDNSTLYESPFRNICKWFSP